MSEETKLADLLASRGVTLSDVLAEMGGFDEEDWADWAESLEDISESHLDFFEGHLEDEAFEAKAAGRQTLAQGALDSIVAPLAALLLLRWMEGLDTGAGSSRSPRDPGSVPALSPDQRWPSWSCLRKESLSEFLSRRLVPALEGPPDAAPGRMLRSLLPVIRTLATLPEGMRDRIVQWVARFDLTSARGRQTARRILARAVRWETEVFEYHRVSFTTPEPLAELMVELLDPKPGELIYDPCFGTGGLLATAVRRVCTDLDGMAGATGLEGPQAAAFGVEINPHAYAVGAAQAVLAGASDPELELRDALEALPTGPGASAGFDCVIAHPPWGRVRPQGSYTLPVATNETAMQFLQHVMASLKPGGRAVVVLPSHVLYRRGPDRTIRRDLLSNYWVEGVIALPAGRLRPHSTDDTNLLVFRRAAPQSAVRFLRVPDAGPVVPRDVAAEFREGELGGPLWQVSVQDLEIGDWELLARKSGHKALARKLKGLGEANPEVETRPLKEVADVLPGKTYQTWTTVESMEGPVTGVGLVRAADITDSGIRVPSVFLAENIDGKPLNPEYRLCFGDVLLTTSGAIGKVGVVDEADLDAVGGHGIAVIRPADGVSARFLKSLLASDAYQDWFRGHARGAALQQLSVAKLRELPIPIPPRALQERVVQMVAGERGDSLAGIVRVLTNTEDPIAEWVQESAEVRDLRQPDSVEDGVALLERIAVSIRKLGARVARPGVRTHPDLAKWLQDIAEPMSALEGLANLPPGAERLAVLDSLLLGLEAIASIQGKPPSPATGLGRDVARQISGLAKAERERMLDEVTLEASVDRSSVPVGMHNEVQVRLWNRSPLALRRLAVSVLPRIGEARATYLAADSALVVPLRIPADAPTGSYGFTLQWRASRLDGRPTKGRVRLAVDVRESRDADRVRELGTSPYIVGSPVEREEMFFGRKEAIDEIRRQLRSDDRANVVLLEGNRRTGKTSILKRLQDPEVLPGWITVNCSLQGGEGHATKAGLPTNEVFRLMARDIGWAAHAAGVHVWLPDVDPPDPGKPFQIAFVKALRHAFSGGRPFEMFELFLQTVIDAAKPRRLLLMLDEFDKLQEGIDAGVTSPQVPENIRYLLHTYPDLSAVLAGSRRIKRLREEYWSALFGFGHRVPVSALPFEDARRLVTQPVDGRLVFVPEARDRVVELCARQPFLIQSLCNRIFESAARSDRRTVAVGDVDEAAHALTEDNEHFRTLWGYAGTERRRFLLSLFRRLRGGMPITLEVLERTLRENGVALRRGERLGDDLEFLRELELLELRGTGHGSAYTLAIPLMADWMERNVDFENQRRMAVEEFEEADRGDGYSMTQEDD